MRSLLVEIGSEELPSKLVAGAIAHIQEGLCSALKTAELNYSVPKAFATPRRLALFFQEVDEAGSDKVQEEKGPPKTACFDKDGNPTKALLGFVTKLVLLPEQIEFKEVGSGTYAFAKRKVQGKTIHEVIATELPKVVLSFPHPHSMRWEESGISWVRPVRWIVALLDDEVVPVKIGSVESGQETRSPRPEKTRKVFIKTAQDYEQVLNSLGVVGNINDRKNFIFSNAQKLAKEVGCTALHDNKLLDELASIVERPHVVLGEYPVEYLATAPELVIKSVLIGNLRFIPFLGKQGALTSKFALTINGPAEIAETVMDGELKVLLGRLSDAKFFFAEDREHKLEDFAGKLSDIAFLKGLGTLADKTKRMMSISEKLSGQLGIDKDSLIQAASLAKTDLATSMVHEHDELQGQIGGLYCELDGMDKELCKAISQHYLPSGEDDPIPTALLAQVLAIIDKADSLLNLIATGSLPKGSADPLGVRRFALGLLRLLLEGGINVSLSSLLEVCNEFGVKPSNEAIAKTIEFLTGRLENVMRAKGNRYDVVRAALAPGISDIKLVSERVQAMQAIYETVEFAGIVATTKRLNNILRDYVQPGQYDKRLFSEDIERSFGARCEAAVAKMKAASTVVHKLLALTELTAEAEVYFDNIMVNCDDEKLRGNRKNFLSWVLLQFRTVSDFVEIAI